MSEKLSFMGSYGEAETVEMMDDDETSSDSEDESKTDFSEVKTNETMDNNNNNSDKFDLNTDNLKTSLNINPNLNEENLVNNNNSSTVTRPILSDKIEPEEDEERKRFQVELEFVQSLANPDYLNFLAQRGYFRNQTFLNYLKYLMYWKEPEYVKYIMYPECLSLLEMLQHEQFLKEIVNSQCSKYIDEQLLLVWLHYKKRRDWLKFDPTKIPNGIEKLFENEQKIETDEERVNDPFTAEAFLAGEKF